mmetsp:Transcript_47383/g.98301  ORF Transcript_47383/g.98301 Transcript_47383/m.98301 type:complete len:201 (+) Transcript_47383:643-1245(+)
MATLHPLHGLRPLRAQRSLPGNPKWDLPPPSPLWLQQHKPCLSQDRCSEPYAVAVAPTVLTLCCAWPPSQQQHMAHPSPQRGSGHVTLEPPTHVGAVAPRPRLHPPPSPPPPSPPPPTSHVRPGGGGGNSRGLPLRRPSANAKSSRCLSRRAVEGALRCRPAQFALRGQRPPAATEAQHQKPRLSSRGCWWPRQCLWSSR